MPEGVTYTKLSDAEEYASEVGGTVVPVDKDGDGATDGFNVIEPQEPGRDEVITKPLRNMGGMMTDELGYMQGGMTEEARGPIKYSKGGAIAGKNFKGSF